METRGRFSPELFIPRICGRETWKRRGFFGRLSWRELRYRYRCEWNNFRFWIFLYRDLCDPVIIQRNGILILKPIFRILGHPLSFDERLTYNRSFHSFIGIPLYKFKLNLNSRYIFVRVEALNFQSKSSAQLNASTVRTHLIRLQHKRKSRPALKFLYILTRHADTHGNILRLHRPAGGAIESNSLSSEHLARTRPHNNPIHRSFSPHGVMGIEIN